jgi:hypothetical protein
MPASTESIAASPHLVSQLLVTIRPEHSVSQMDLIGSLWGRLSK